jgi:hypothetical protein
MRYTPAGLPALDVGLKHESELSENGLPRKVSMEMRAVAIGEVTQASRRWRSVMRRCSPASSPVPATDADCSSTSRQVDLPG